MEHVSSPPTAVVTARPGRGPVSRHVAFLRGINLGERRVTNEELRRHVRDAGFDDVDAYLASGNVVFEPGDHPDPGPVIEERLERALGYGVDTHVRSLQELAALLSRDEVAADEAFRVHVIFLRTEPDGAAIAGLKALEGPDDRLRPLGRQVVWLRRGRLHDAAFGTRDLEEVLGPEQTMRTLNTVRRIVDRFGE